MPVTRLPNQGALSETTAVSALDPLRADANCARVPAMNAEADVRALARALAELVPSMARVESYSLVEGLAAMRDLGMFIGSLKRHGVQPRDAVPALEPVLIALGERTDMIPRETVHHYTEWNPVGGRQRMYTGDPQETFLMTGARMSLPHLGASVDLCHRLADADPHDPDFGSLLTELTGEVAAFDHAISMVVDKVAPEFFARELRPYYEEVTVGDRVYLGPAAAHLPLFLVDLLVWASDNGHAVYDEFIGETAWHTLPQWRTLVPRWGKGPSLVTKVSAALSAVPDGTDPPPALRAASAGVCDALRMLIRFRGKHLAIARKAYDEELRLYDVGSGGAPIELLKRILALTKENSTTVVALHGNVKAGAGRGSVDG